MVIRPSGLKASLKNLPELRLHKFQASPIKKVWIPKPDGGKRPLGISSQKDKIVQATILERLEKETEKVFLDCSYGFRPKRGCHDALHFIKRKWQNVTWLISIDISKYFDSIHHPVLIDLLKPYGDQAFIELVGKLPAGYMDISNLSNRWERASEGVTQGSLISPVLANIYLHELDVFVTNELIPMYTTGDERRFVEGYASRKTLTSEEISLLKQVGIEGIVEAVQAHKHNLWVSDGLGTRDQYDPNFSRLHYIRYADDLILGYTGSKESAVEIRNKVIEFICNKLKLKVNVEKSKINHSSDKNILFLGYFIRYLAPKKTTSPTKVDNITQSKMVAINQAQLRIPVERILNRLKTKVMLSLQRGYIQSKFNRKLTSFR